MPEVDVTARADDVMDRLGDNPTKAKLDRAWRELDALRDQVDRSWHGALLTDRYETLANLYALRGLEAPR